MLKGFSEWFGLKTKLHERHQIPPSSPSEKFGGRALEKMSGQRSMAKARRSREQSSFTRSSRMDFISSSRQQRKRRGELVRSTAGLHQARAIDHGRLSS